MKERDSWIDPGSENVLPGALYSRTEVRMWRCGGSDRAGNLRERMISRQEVLARQEAVAEQVREIPPNGVRNNFRENAWFLIGSRYLLDSLICWSLGPGCSNP